jgi:hypothetical protein
MAAHSMPSRLARMAAHSMPSRLARMAAADLTRLLPRTRPRCSAPFAAPSRALRRPVALRSRHRPRTCSHSWPSMMSTQLAPSRRRCGAPTLLAAPLSRPLLPLSEHVTATPRAPSLLYYYTPSCRALPLPICFAKRRSTLPLHSPSLTKPSRAVPVPERRRRPAIAARRSSSPWSPLLPPSSILGSPLNRFSTSHWSSPAGPRRSSLAGVPSAPRAPSVGAAAPWHRHHRPS